MQISLTEWKDFLKNHPEAHLLQTAEWGELKSGFGWKPVRIVNANSGVQILFRMLPFGYSIAYIPKGPTILKNELLHEVDQACRENNAIFLKFEPDLWEPFKDEVLLNVSQWVRANPIQPRRTVFVPLTGSEDEILSRMKQKTRYNIRLAEKKEVIVKSSADFNEFHRLTLQTAQRDAFGVHSSQYYQKVYDLFHPHGKCELLTAYYDHKPLAAIMVLTHGETAYYLYGASSDLERNRMPTYLIQWEAMKWARNQHCRWYDLWGIPDMDDENLEKEFLQRRTHDGLWGVYRFKRGFGGETRRTAGAWDRVYNRPLYHLYQLYIRLRKTGLD
jgi:lipid II:glycine glycyltransferase (peptidoglycan interpeptide bridge formation enzyme)